LSPISLHVLCYSCGSCYWGGGGSSWAIGGRIAPLEVL
jgi:hypothetical protein